MSNAVENLEHEFAAWLGLAGAVATGFGRSALALAVEAGVPPGSDVLVPDFICAQVPEAVRRAACTPVFYPVRRDLIVRPEDLNAVRTPQTRAAVVAHYFGRVQPHISELARCCRESGLLLIEDCALALGARSGQGWAGSEGTLAVFSFTKTDWCYGGGLLAARSEEIAEKAVAIRARKFRTHAGLAFRYGLLRRADFAANRPRWCRVAERAGRWLERVRSRTTAAVGAQPRGLGAAPLQPAREEGTISDNFYDSGRFDAAMTEQGARRASRILRSLPVTVRRRREILMGLQTALTGTGLLLAQELAPADSGDYLLLQCPQGNAAGWVEEADRAGVTLRRCWPAYQSLEAGQQASAEIAWLAERLLLLELHHALVRREVERIAVTLIQLTEVMKGSAEPA